MGCGRGRRAPGITQQPYDVVLGYDALVSYEKPTTRQPGLAVYFPSKTKAALLRRRKAPLGENRVFDRTDALAARAKALTEKHPGHGTADCPIRQAVLLFAEDKWRLIVFLELARSGEMQFGEIRRAVSGIRPKALTKALRALEDSALLCREVRDGVPTRVAYRLTERANLAVPILVELSDWLFGYVQEAPEQFSDAAPQNQDVASAFGEIC
jgi:DNA-binding HxlR family transcriptional regulator